MAALLLFFQDMVRTPPFALGENTKRGGWEDHQEHLTRRKWGTSLLIQLAIPRRFSIDVDVYSGVSDPMWITTQIGC